MSVAPWPRASSSRSGGEVDADDALGALQAAAGDRAEPDHSRAEDGAGAAGLHRGGVDRRPEAGREAAGEEAGVLERRLGVDLRQGDLRHHRVLGEGRAAHEVADPVAVARDPGGAVGKEALVLLLADRHAEVGPGVEAVDALAALGREEGDDVVAGGEGGDVGADPLDDAGALVAEHGRRVARGVGAGGGVEVGVADAAGDEADEHLAGPRLGQLDLLDRERLPELLQHRGAHLHLLPAPLLNRS